MFSSIRSFGVSGIGGYGVTVEVNISNGLPGFDKVSAYLQGLIEKVKHKRSGGSDASSAEILSDYEGTE